MAASNVIPLLPLASPNRVPEIGAAAPAMVMSRKSMSAAPAVRVPTVSVLVVPMVSDAKNVRYADAVPAFSVRVLMVWLALIETEVMPTDVRLANNSVLNVFTPVMALVPTVFVKLTLLNVNPPQTMPASEPERLIWLVPALKVKLATLIALNDDKDIALSVTVLPLKTRERTFELFDANAPDVKE